MQVLHNLIWASTKVRFDIQQHETYLTKACIQQQEKLLSMKMATTFPDRKPESWFNLSA